MYEEGDVRRDATIWDVRGYTYTERYQDTHLWLGKYRPYSDNNKDCPTSKNLNYNNNKRIYRYAETLLNAAEPVARYRWQFRRGIAIPQRGTYPCRLDRL